MSCRTAHRHTVSPLYVYADEFADCFVCWMSYHTDHTHTASHLCACDGVSVMRHCLSWPYHRGHKDITGSHPCVHSCVLLVISCMQILCHMFHIQMAAYHDLALDDVSAGVLLSSVCGCMPCCTHHIWKVSHLYESFCEPGAHSLCNNLSHTHHT